MDTGTDTVMDTVQQKNERIKLKKLTTSSKVKKDKYGF
jgi:hypothetical protein